MTGRIDYPTAVPDSFKALLTVERYARHCGIEQSLLELIKLRASYVRRQTPFFTPRERAALLWTETITYISRAGVPDAIYQEARERCPEVELMNLSMAIIAIDAWIRMSIAFRGAAEVGSYQVPATSQA
jgi:hypothetical protein